MIATILAICIGIPLLLLSVRVFLGVVSAGLWLLWCVLVLPLVVLLALIATPVLFAIILVLGVSLVVRLLSGRGKRR
ncbi:MAG: hypothetical protein NUV93_02870 [Firmicutes bacterium]|nr:hypothetical protein [Bacillota bacterium]